MHQLDLHVTCDGAMDLGAILQFNGDRLMAEFHQKPVRIKQNCSEYICLSAACYLALQKIMLTHKHPILATWSTLAFGCSFQNQNKQIAARTQHSKTLFK